MSSLNKKTIKQCNKFVREHQGIQMFYCLETDNEPHSITADKAKVQACLARLKMAMVSGRTKERNVQISLLVALPDQIHWTRMKSQSRIEEENIKSTLLPDLFETDYYQDKCDHQEFFVYNEAIYPPESK